MNKVFGDLQVGQRFSLNGTEYIKENEVRISCCKSVNCSAVGNSNNKIYVQATTEVTVNG